jgi:hypothetical protein
MRETKRRATIQESSGAFIIVTPFRKRSTGSIRHRDAGRDEKRISEG